MDRDGARRRIDARRLADDPCAQALVARARPILAERSVGFEAQRCMADILDGRIALARGDRSAAIKSLQQAVRCADAKGQNLTLPPLARYHLALALLTPAEGLDQSDALRANPRELLQEAATLVEPMGDITLARDITTAIASLR